MTVDEFVDALETAGYEWRSYSGRGMFGRECVGVVLERDTDLFILGLSLGREFPEEKFQSPAVDNMGTQMIAYWPQFQIKKEP